jgi:hypothetical protein
MKPVCAITKESKMNSVSSLPTVMAAIRDISVGRSAKNALRAR